MILDYHKETGKQKYLLRGGTPGFRFARDNPLGNASKMLFHFKPSYTPCEKSLFLYRPFQNTPAISQFLSL